MTAIKSYLGHSLAAAGGDQMISTLGSWKNNIIPGITSTPELAENVHKENVRFLLKNKRIEDDEFDFAVLNAKGFGGNNGTSLVASPSQTMKMLESKYSKSDIQKYLKKKSKIDDQLNDSKQEILQGDTKSRYIFGESVIDGMNDFDIEADKITNKSNKEIFDLNSTLPYKDYLSG